MLMKFKIIKMCFTTPLHLGEVGIGIEGSTLILHSDTIFNAICNALAKLYGSEWVTDFLEKFKLKPDFRISSGFPFIENNLYFPKPFSRANIERELRQNYGKKLKKTNYLTKHFFEKWIAGDNLTENELKNITKKEITLLNGDKISKFHEEMILPKVAVNRESAESNIYFLGSVHFAKKAGLWFIVDCEDDIYRDKVLPALRLLQHEGIGGKRTWGLGRFELEEDSFYLKLPDVNTRLLLSLFYPKISEKKLFSSEKAKWGFTLRGGYAYPYGAGRSFQKPQRLLISEGSIFETRPRGKLIEYPIYQGELESLYQYGIAYSIPISVRQEEEE